MYYNTMATVQKNDYFDELKFPIETLSKVLDEYRNQDNITIELFIGTGAENEDDYIFKQGLFCEEFYDKIFKLFEKSNVWEDKTNNSFERIISGGEIPNVYIKNNKKITEQKILKEFTFKYNSTPYDFQVVVFENKVIQKLPQATNYDRSSFKTTEFLLKNNRICLYEEETEINEIIEINHGIFIRLENLLNSKKISTKYLVHDMLLKVRDVINHLEEIESSCEISLVSFYG